MPHAQVGHRFAALLAGVLLGDVRSHRTQHVQQAGAARIHADPAQQQLRARHQGGRDDEERRGRNIRRHADIARLQREAAQQGRFARHERTGHAERGEHAFAVVAGGMRLAHVGLAIRVQAGQQQRGFHLRACDRQAGVDALQRPSAADAQRRAAAIGFDQRAHRRQRLDHPPHRPLRQGRVADQHAVEALPGQQPGQQPHRGAGIAAVQRFGRWLQAVQAHAMHDAHAIGWGVDLYAEPAEDRGGGAGVLALKEALDAGHALGDRAKHDRAMRHRLVAGHRHGSVQRAGGRGDPGAGGRRACRHRIATG